MQELDKATLEWCAKNLIKHAKAAGPLRLDLAEDESHQAYRDRIWHEATALFRAAGRFERMAKSKRCSTAAQKKGKQ